MPLQTPRFPAPDLDPIPECLGGLEVQSIPRGLVAVDALVKKAACRVVMARPVSPGKMLILLDGSVAEVEESLEEAWKVAGDLGVDRVFLPHAHPLLEPAVFGTLPAMPDDSSLGLVEPGTVCSGLSACDAALKAAEVVPVVVHLSVGIGGKCWYALGGDLHEVQAAVAASREAAGEAHLLSTEVIPNPHPEFLQALGL